MSYWSESLGTTYTGVKRDVPAVVAIAALREQWYLHDALDLDPLSGMPRLWRASNPSGNGLILCGPAAPITCVFARNGYLLVGTGMGLHVISLTGDWCDRYDNGGRRRRLGTFAQRNTVIQEGAVFASAALISTQITGVHAEVLPFAPLDPTGMPIPTVVVTTPAGASVIHPNGQVAQIMAAQGFAGVLLRRDGQLWLSDAAGHSVYVGPVPYQTVSYGAWATKSYNRVGSVGVPSISYGGAKRIAAGAVGGDDGGFSHPGLTFLGENIADPTASMVAYATKDYATGWMPGDIRLATLCDATTGSITGGTVADRSCKAKPLTIVGTLQRQPVAAGANVVAWSDFTPSNYIFQPYNPDLDYPGDFYVCFWVNNTSSWNVLFDRSAPTGAFWRCDNIGSGGGPTTDQIPRFYIGDGTNNAGVVLPSTLRGLGYTQCWFVRRGSTLEAYVKGDLVATGSAASVGSLANAAATLTVGNVRTLAANANSSVSMFRAGAGAPTPAQIRRIYEDERPLFAEGAKSLLGGTSNTVTSLDRDPLTGRLAVGTGDGASVFAGLRRVAYYDEVALAATTSDAVRTVSLRGGVLLIGTASEVGFVCDAIGGKEAIAVSGPRPVGAGFVARGVTADGAALDLTPRVPVGERETVMIEARFVGRVTGAADTERLTYVRRATYFRDAGGAITLQGSVQTVGSDTEVTGTADATLAIVGDWVSARVTGVASKRIVWSATFTVTRLSEETSYAA